MTAPIPLDEAARLEALREYGLLDTVPEQAFDDLTLLAAQICQTPIALVSLVDDQRQWFKSKIGMSATETSRDIAFCAHTILNRHEILEVRDAEADARFRDSPLVTSDPHVRFYAGAPLVNQEGHSLGALCVMDRSPRSLSPEQLAALGALSRLVVGQLEMRRQSRSLAEEIADRQHAKTVLRGQFEELAASKLETERLLELAEKSRRALLSVLEDEKQAGQKLRESEERFRQLAENIQEVFWITNTAKNQMIYVSPAYEKIWGRTCDSLLQSPQSWLEAIHPEDLTSVREAALNRQSHGEYTEEYRIIRPDGTSRWISDRGFPVHNAAGEVYRIVGTASDITERKGLEADLRKSEAEFRVAFENAAIGVALVGTDGRPIKTNRALQDLLGYSGEELRALKFSEFTHPEDLEENLALFQEMLAGKREYYQMEKRFLRKGGNVVHARLTSSAVRGANGRPDCCISLVEDITEKKKLEAQFLRAQRLESIGTLAGGIAHDLNNVLTPILMSCEMLQLEAKDEDTRNLLGMIRTSAQRGAELVQQVLSFARGLEGRSVEVQPKHLIREIATIARETFPKSIRVQANLTEHLWIVEGDPTQLHQVLLNLCVNARDAMLAGGELTISAQNALANRDFPEAGRESKPHPFVVIKVSDTGIGIPPEIKEKIFDPFFTTKEVGKGTGLGLSTSLGIVKSHGGFINVESKSGQGTTFEVWLPASDGLAAVPAQAEKSPFPQGNGELILVVDDESQIRELTRKTLEAHGFGVLTARNGADAVVIYLRHQEAIEVVITDMMMPVMDGPGLTLALRTINPAVRIIAVSGLCNAQTQAKAVSLGANRFLPKPYSAETLLSCVAGVINEWPRAHSETSLTTTTDQEPVKIP